jgi:hypothetical protein
MMMRLHSLVLTFLLALSLSGCGAGQDADARAQSRPTLLAAATVKNPLVIFPGLRSDYTITLNTPQVGWDVTDTVGTNGSVHVPYEARLRFADTSIALDVNNGTAAKAYRIYQAAFNRVPDLPGLGYWIGAMDQGMSLHSVASAFVNSAEFKAQYGDEPSNADLLTKFYRNVLHRAGDADGVAYWMSVLDTHAATRPQVLVQFSEGDENVAGVFRAVMGGIAYLEDGVAYIPAAHIRLPDNVFLGEALVVDGSFSTVATTNKASYAWTLTDKPAGSGATLMQATSAKPTITPDVQGMYYLSLTVSDGHMQSPPLKASFYAYHSEPAVITTQPANQSVVLGMPATFSVTVAGDGPISYIWMRDGTLIPGALGPSYTIASVQFADTQSKYSVMVLNLRDTLTSTQASLNARGIEVLAGPGAYGPDLTSVASRPSGVVVDSAHNIYFADADNLIRMLSPQRKVVTVAGGDGEARDIDGTGTAARFGSPGPMTIDGAGNLYVADLTNVLRKITPAGIVTTLAGMSRVEGTADGVGAAARFSYMTGVVVDNAGNLYVADFPAHTIRKVTQDGVVTTFAGKAGVRGVLDGPGGLARLDSPAGLAIDAQGNIYVSDPVNQLIRKITKDGVVSTLAGSAGGTGSSDGLGSAARFNMPSCLAIDAAGNLYVWDYGNRLIRKITPAGQVTTVAGTAGVALLATGALPGSLATINGMAVDSNGYLIVTTGDDQIMEIQL